MVREKQSDSIEGKVNGEESEGKVEGLRAIHKVEVLEYH
jgi:hypothetical protein